MHGFVADAFECIIVQAHARIQTAKTYRTEKTSCNKTDFTLNLNSENHLNLISRRYRDVKLRRSVYSMRVQNLEWVGKDVT